MLREVRLAFLVIAMTTQPIILAASGQAGTISMASSLTSKDVDGRRAIEVAVKNSGDEPAKSVQPHVEVGGQELSGPVWDRLAPGESNSHVFVLERVPTEPGNYPVLLSIDFADLNLYPFTALNVGTLTIGSAPAKAQLFAKARPLEITKSGKLGLLIRNLENDPKKVKARVASPREIDIQPTSFDLDLAAGATVDRSLNVANFSALPGAGYPVFVLFEYDKGGAHYFHALTSVVSIGKGGLSRRWAGAIVAGGVILIAAALALQVLRRKTKAGTASGSSSR